MMHIKGADEIGKSDNVMYRYNYSGNNITDPVKVIAFEMVELGNTDIPDYWPPPNVIVYGFTMYDDVLTDEQVQYLVRCKRTLPQ